ncbi:MAG TPA: 2-dehydropantoate 2-reductase [Caldimonas sp.]|nr:2-dehydropantoate 2-reductase [Caldimonas sp.]
MRILMLGAGAIGGYFGGRLVQAGGDVTFLVRERRAAQLRDRGLMVKSPHGDFHAAAPHILSADGQPPFDLVMLACKAYDLEGAIASVRAAVGPETHVLPLLNGLAHLDRLAAEFGAERVLGGSCGIPATLTPEGEVVQLAPFHRIVFGMLPGTSPAAAAKVQILAALYARTPVEVVVAPDMLLELWEKFVGLTTLAAMTCLMRGTVGDIVSTGDGARLMSETYDACANAAAAAGHAPRTAAAARFKEMLTQAGSSLAASMLRDLAAGRPTEAEHIVGDMLHRCVAAGADPVALRAAWCHLQVYERQRVGAQASATA